MIRLSEKLFLALIIVTFVLPAPLTLWIDRVKLGQQLLGNATYTQERRRASAPDWIANRTLYGITIKSDLPSVSLASWLNGDLQKRANALVSDNFAGRELLIRIFNQTLYTAFRKSYMNLEMIIVGKHGDLFERNYLAVYGRFEDPIPNAEAEALVVMMKYLSERLKELGSCFVFVITPSKATIYPKDIPDRYLANFKSRERRLTNYEVLVPLLQKYGIPYVDGRKITLDHKSAFPVRAYPKTGTHWTRAVAFFTTLALIKTIERESGREMPQLSESIESIDRRPDSRPIPADAEQRRTGKVPVEADSVDDDLFKLLNLIQKPNQSYLHASFHIPEGGPKRVGTLTVVGGSYMSAILDSLNSANVFERINHYSYFRDSRHRLPDNILDPVDENAIPWKEDFWNTTAVVLEANEEAMARRHLPAFLMATLAALQQNGPPERAADDPTRPLSWGFGAGENGSALVKKGFNSPDHQFTWILGRDAEIDLPSPARNTQLQLILEALPFLGDGAAERIVKVEANGIPVGTLELVDPSMQFYSLTIKAAANTAASLKLHFSLSPPPSPALDGKLPEIGLARLALVPIKLPVSGEAAENGAPEDLRRNSHSANLAVSEKPSSPQ
jgi:alginate O-acetyltransferase complex protein AlgJ